MSSLIIVIFKFLCIFANELIYNYELQDLSINYTDYNDDASSRRMQQR